MGAKHFYLLERIVLLGIDLFYSTYVVDNYRYPIISFPVVFIDLSNKL